MGHDSHLPRNRLFTSSSLLLPLQKYAMVAWAALAASRGSLLYFEGPIKITPPQRDPRFGQHVRRLPASEALLGVEECTSLCV